EGKAIRIHPMVCKAFNADFDGDQMAVHVPLSFEAQIETSLLMLSSNNILSPAHGRPLATPNQDIVLGCHYLTKSRSESPNPRVAAAAVTLEPGDPRRLRCFYSPGEVRAAYDNAEVGLHGLISLQAASVDLPREEVLKLKHGFVETTPGRVLFNEVVPEELGFINATMDKKKLEGLVGDCYSQLGAEKTSDLLDALKNLGFKYAT